MPDSLSRATRAEIIESRDIEWRIVRIEREPFADLGQLTLSLFNQVVHRIGLFAEISLLEFFE